MKKVIIDCDPGIDDALAIIFALKSGIIKIEAITTVAGNTSLLNSTKNALKVLELINMRSVPVYMGAETPLIGEIYNSEEVHGKNGLAGLDGKAPQQTPQDAHALDFLSSYFTTNKQDTSLIALGPLTNLANLSLKFPKVLSNIKELIIMGGAIHIVGNISPQAEFNIFCDPKAADLVFKSNIQNITLVPLDVTRKVIFTPDHLQTISDAKIKNRELKKFLIDSLEFYQSYCIKNSKLKGCPLHDPLAIGECIDPTFTEKKDLILKVIDEEMNYKSAGNQNKNLTRGKMILRSEFPHLFSGNRPKIRTCLKVDSHRFLKYFTKTLTS